MEDSYKYKISVIIPAYNEGEKITGVLEKLRAILGPTSQSYEIIVINDGSTDDTGRQARICGTSVITHDKNEGYGKSLKDGIRLSRGEFILFIDADGTYDIDAIPEMLRLSKEADLVIGKRVFLEKSRDSFKNIARRFFAYLTSYYSGRKIEDLNSGQRVFRRRDIIDRLNVFPDGFSFTSTMTVLYTIENKTISYTPVRYKHREEGSKFKSLNSIYSIAKLTLSLTMKNRTFLLSLQLCTVFISAAFLSKIIAAQLHAGFFLKLIFFIILAPLSFFSLLCYIYARGKTVT